MVRLRTVLALFLVMLAVPAQAVSLLRDPDIENALNQMARPVLTAAGLSGATPVLVVNDQSLNAFVVDTNAIYINAGLILRTTSAAELQFVIAHEAAHIVNGHVTSRALTAQHVSRIAGLGMALAVATAAGTGNGKLGLAALGVANSAQRSYFSHTQAEESSADQSGIRFMALAGVGTQGALDVTQIFAGQELISEGRQDPYVQSHPLSRDRLRRLTALAGTYGLAPTGNRDQDTYWFDRARGKLSAFLRAPKWTRARADESVAKDIAWMRLAIAQHRDADWRGAVDLLARAQAIRPNDPWYFELKGQILLEGRQFAASQAAYRRAADLAPGNPLILASLGHSMVVQGGSQRLQQALPVLERARAGDYRNGSVLRDLGSAYAQLNQPGNAALTVAEYHALAGRMKDARIQAQRAVDMLPNGSPGWQRAQDVLNAARNAQQ
ncbi:peptidase M48 [Pseudooceanicola sediminis]|uniref:Peptidase M48 n=2 Tax=Pseudooceanicola sediminis TaxID=2211117 RepID=A0A399J5R5_9RHOB|nr:M48 family metalloprotease [Puniceibacterium sp. HSS470]RII40823.1 peptidase M48 [Pseudooceanicola sediminis]